MAPLACKEAQAGRRVRCRADRVIARRATRRATVVIPRRCLRSREYAKSFAGRWHQVHARTAARRPPPIGYGPLAADFERLLDPEFPELGVLELVEAFLVGPDGWVVSREGHLLPDHNWYGRHVDEMPIPRRPFKVVRLGGTCLSLASDSAGTNYGHFLLDGLCRFDLFQRAGFSIGGVDHVFCAVPSANAWRLLERLGIPRAKCFTAAPDTAVQADLVLAPSFPGTRRSYPRWVAQFLRGALLSRPVRPRRRLYIPRATTRKIVNEEELLPVVAAHGFEVFDPLAHAWPPGHFAEASIVVGAHGAGLADLAFCQPGSRVLELIPSDHISPYWYTLAAAAELRHRYLIGRSVVERKLGYLAGPSPYDFHVDPVEFRRALDSVVAMK